MSVGAVLKQDQAPETHKVLEGTAALTKGGAQNRALILPQGQYWAVY